MLHPKKAQKCTESVREATEAVATRSTASSSPRTASQDSVFAAGSDRQTSAHAKQVYFSDTSSPAAISHQPSACHAMQLSV